MVVSRRVRAIDPSTHQHVLLYRGSAVFLTCCEENGTILFVPLKTRPDSTAQAPSERSSCLVGVIEETDDYLPLGRQVSQSVSQWVVPSCSVCGSGITFLTRRHRQHSNDTEQEEDEEGDVRRSGKRRKSR